MNIKIFWIFMIYIYNTYFYQTPGINWQQDRFYASKHLCSIEYVNLRSGKSKNTTKNIDVSIHK